MFLVKNSFTLCAGALTYSSHHSQNCHNLWLFISLHHANISELVCKTSGSLETVWPFELNSELTIQKYTNTIQKFWIAYKNKSALSWFHLVCFFGDILIRIFHSLECCFLSDHWYNTCFNDLKKSWGQFPSILSIHNMSWQFTIHPIGIYFDQPWPHEVRILL